VPLDGDLGSRARLAVPINEDRTLIVEGAASGTAAIPRLGGQFQEQKMVLFELVQGRNRAKPPFCGRA
jgi:hypothetical protein